MNAGERAGRVAYYVGVAAVVAFVALVISAALALASLLLRSVCTSW
jgi:hypothetical protein